MWRTTLAWSKPRDAKHSRIRNTAKPARYDLAQRVQSASPLVPAADGVHRRHGTDIPGSARVGFRQRKSHWLDRACFVSSDVCELCAGTQAFPNEPIIDSGSAVRDNFLRVRNHSFGSELLPRQRWSVEGASSGCANVSIETWLHFFPYG